MPRAIFIPADGSVELTEVELSSLSDYQAAVGGYIEQIDLVEPAFAVSSLIVNEEGKIHGLLVNKRATLLLWLHQPALRLRDEIVGDAVLIGQPNLRGNTTDVPNRLKRLLMGSESWVIEMVSTNIDATKRVHRTGPFRSWVNAYVVAPDICMAVPDMTEVCVVPE